MKNNLALKRTQRSLPDGTVEVAAYYADPVRALNILRQFFESLSEDIANKSTSIEEWELIAEFVEKVISNQIQLAQEITGNLDYTVLAIQLEDLKEEFDKRLHQLRGTSPGKPETKIIQEQVGHEIMEASNIPDTLEPTDEDLAMLEQELGNMESDEELMEFMRREFEKEPGI